MKEYLFRYDKGYIGQKVFLINSNDEVEEDTIIEIQDNSYRIAVIDGDWATDQDGDYIIERCEDWPNVSIGFWVENNNPGHALYFGDELFETREEAEEILKLELEEVMGLRKLNT